ncbi:MAG: TlpA family protein disulfide reductase [Myxococcales bacterium]|nr:TlpA family protein disulfide reductase [Myxococcales bacterium]MDH3483398.1 TlpA family protein disulfide reductase [Myxococcales bacterium]
MKSSTSSACSLGLLVIVCVTATAHALTPGDTPPPINLPDRTGKEVDLGKLKGKVVLIDFWASWCGPCKQEIPVLEALHKKYASKGLVIVGVNIDNSDKKMNNFLKATPVTFRQVRDKKLQVASRYEPSTMPSSYFIGRDGKIRHVHEGFRKSDAGTLEARVEALLAESPRD